MLERAPDEKKQKYLLAVADACDSQGSFHLASKNYTQAGDRLSAIKALIKSGDAEKVKFFASVSGSKQPEIYIIAANFLQTQNWHENGELLKSIITFYTKVYIVNTIPPHRLCVIF
jgi:intraflagellar transport protein 140